MHPHVHARTTPDKPACVMSGSGEIVTYRQLEDGSNRVAQMLRAAGLRPGDHIAILLENHPRFFEVCFGAHRAGVLYTAISTRLFADEAAYIVNDCGARVLITSRAMAPLAEQTLPLTPALRSRLMMDGAAPGHDSYEEVVARYPAERIADETPGGDMLYSSGTTGRPKGVRSPPDGPTVDELGPSGKGIAAVFGFNPSMVYLSPAPLYHAAPLRFCMLTMRVGGTCVLMERFDAEDFLQQVEHHRATHCQVVPTMFVRMLKLPEEARKRHDVSSLRYAIHAAAPCPVPVKEQMMEWWGPILWEYYAGTEGNGFVMVSPRDWLSHKGTVGRPVFGVARICDDEGNELGPGERGTVYFSDGRPFEYHNDPQKTAESKNARGWTTLGDVGYKDADGYLYLTDRKAFTIITGGVNVYPQEVENLLVMHPEVADVAVLGVPNDELGEEVKAVVQPRDIRAAGKALEHELIAYCRARLSHIKCPASVDFEESLPRHPTGKLYKRLLQDRYWKGHKSRIV